MKIKLKSKDVEWIVNDSAELGVRINGQCFFLYKGHSLQYKKGEHDSGVPMKVRLVGKREFGECCHPIHLDRLPDTGYVEGEGWEPISSKKKRKETK